VVSGRFFDQISTLKFECLVSPTADIGMGQEQRHRTSDFGQMQIPEFRADIDIDGKVEQEARVPRHGR
jgi:hypothetical protein